MALLEFIQILLLVLLILPACTCYTVSESTSDTIYANEIAYFNVASTRPVIVALLSTEGDVDAYASPTSKNPKPSGVDYDFCSASCGMDLLMLPMSAESSKYTLGLFGHMRYEKSVYKLFIIEPSEEDIQYFQACFLLCGFGELERRGGVGGVGGWGSIFILFGMYFLCIS